MVAVSSSPLFNNDFPLDTTSTPPYRARRAHDAVATAIIGAAAGSTATTSWVRIKGSGGNNDTPHGKATLETFTPINRATTAQDVTNLKAETTQFPRPALAFPKDLGGNGGPAFTRT